ncbi:MAG: hypothetical protein IJU23_01645, partial [Proteobacteria bacterium]|nr:hypothetical protein [Pseudomonadota bacterium]
MRKYSLYAIFVFLACMAFGCGQSLPKTPAEVQNRIVNWEVDTINPLLAYVPEDAPVVFASRRVYDENSNAFNTLYDRLKVVALDDVAKAYRSASHEIEYPTMYGGWYDDDDYDSDDDYDDDDDVNFSSVDNYERKLQEQKERAERKQRNELKKKATEKYNEWIKDCGLPTLDDGDEGAWEFSQFKAAYDQTVTLLSEEACEGANANSCHCRLKEFKVFKDNDSDESLESFDYDDIIDDLKSFKHEYEDYQITYLDRDRFGLNPLETQDAVAYMKDSHIVLHFGVLDETKVLTEVVRRVESDKDGLFDEKLIREDKQIDGRNWIFYSSKTAEDKIKFGIHGENNVVTLTLFVDDIDLPGDVLSFKSNPIKQSEFGQLSSEAVIAGRIDFAGLGKLFTSGKFAGLFDEKVNRELNY